MPESALHARIEAMYSGDRLAAWILVFLLWAVTAFVLTMSWPLIPNETVRYVVLAAAAVVLVFNTAAIAAMMRHYSADKEFIYALDLKNLDAMSDSQK